MCNDHRDRDDSSDDDFPESLFHKLCDAHCHPHDDRQHLQDIAHVKTGHMTIMGVRQDDWDVVQQVAERCNSKDQPTKCVPAFGLHPWFVYRVMAKDETDKEAHYETVLSATKPEEKVDMMKALEEPFAFDKWYSNLRDRLIKNPRAIIGEVGLDRAARLLPGGAIEWHGVKPTTVQCTIEHQLAILSTQLELARELNRSVSIHCVQGQGHLLTLLQRLGDKKRPVRIDLHSYGGSAATIAQFMQLKGYEVYVSFSTAINGRLPQKKMTDLIKAVPKDRLLLESDLNKPEGLDDSMTAIARLVSKVHEWTLEETVQQTFENWHYFIGHTSEE
ncbi:TatD family [Radiomyces spectabilis]|uniref:TatD family n=1 Tax=Radiomyces spectabilis TaxID=64574 RepID=UPI002220B3DD|nr:TatD family [Radiomyces spectabilis]KAI8377963.1 TatD family [Radiomyces spectabilis]